MTYSWTQNVIDGQSFLLNQTTTFTVTGVNANGCSNSDQITVSVNQTPLVNAGNDITICENQSPVTLFYNVNQAISAASWNTGETTQSIQVDSASSYIITVTNINNCTSSDTITVTSNPITLIDIENNQVVCSNNLPLSLNVDATGNQLSFLWSTGQTTQQINVEETGIYSVIIINEFNCESTSEVSVQVIPAPNVNAGNDITVCEYDFPVTLNATGNGAEVEWSNGALTPFTSVTSPGTYSVTTTAQNGCQATDSIVVASDPCVGIEENVIEFSIFPNPTLDVVFIKTNYPNIENFELLNSTGQIVLKGLLNNQPIFVGDLAKGAYIIRIFNSEKEFFGRIVKQ